MSKMSQAVLRARRCSVERLVGRMIHRITRETTSGEMLAVRRVERNVERGFGVVWWRARRWMVRRGMVGVWMESRFSDEIRLNGIDIGIDVEIYVVVSSILLLW